MRSDRRVGAAGRQAEAAASEQRRHGSARSGGTERSRAAAGSRAGSAGRRARSALLGGHRGRRFGLGRRRGHSALQLREETYKRDHNQQLEDKARQTSLVEGNSGHSRSGWFLLGLFGFVLLDFLLLELLILVVFVVISRVRATTAGLLAILSLQLRSANQMLLNSRRVQRHLEQGFLVSAAVEVLAQLLERRQLHIADLALGRCSRHS